MLTPPRRTAIHARVSHTPYGSVARRCRVLLAVFAGFALDGCGGDSSGPDVGPPTQLLVTAGASQTGVFRQPTAIVPMVLVTDAQNRPVPNVVVTFQLQSGGGTITASTATTDASGNATPGTWTLGSTFGSKTLTASVTGLQSVTFSATAIAPDAGVQAFSLTDAANDTLPPDSMNLPRGYDLTQMRGDFKRDSMILTLTFASPIPSGTGAVPVIGVVDFDTDDQANTGDTAFGNEFGGTANIGVDYYIVFNSQVTALLVSFPGGVQTTLRFAASGNTITLRVPMLAFGNDDGNFAMSGVIGTPDRVTDIFPNSGATLVRPTDALANLSSAGRQMVRPNANSSAQRRSWQSVINRR